MPCGSPAGWWLAYFVAFSESFGKRIVPMGESKYILYIYFNWHFLLWISLDIVPYPTILKVLADKTLEGEGEA